MSTASSDSLWRHRLAPRLLAQWPIKSAVIAPATALFFVAYFATLNATPFLVTEMPVTALDRTIGFWPGALGLYVSLWVYVTLVPALLDSRRELLGYYLATAAMSLVGLTIFYFWPTATPDSGIDWQAHPWFVPLKTADHSGNAFPSLHVCFAMFSGLWLDRLLRQMRAGKLARGLNAAWCVGILYSTLATKQHVAVDLFAGAVLGCAGMAGLHRFLQPVTHLWCSVPGGGLR